MLENVASNEVFSFFLRIPTACSAQKSTIKTLKHQGFTLIELIVVIVILGTLAATAMPKYMNMRAEAYRAATEGIAAGLRSAVLLSISANRLKKPENEANTAHAKLFTQDGTAFLVNGVPTSRTVAPTLGVPINSKDGIGALMGCANAIDATGKGECQGNEVSNLLIAQETSVWKPKNAPFPCGAIYNGNTGEVTVNYEVCPTTTPPKPTARMPTIDDCPEHPGYYPSQFYGPQFVEPGEGIITQHLCIYQGNDGHGASTGIFYWDYDNGRRV